MSAHQDRVCIGKNELPGKLDQVLKDQLTPAFSVRLYQQCALRKPAQIDGGKTQPFRQRTNLGDCARIVAGQEHDSPTALYGRILGKNRSDQMVEGLDQFSAPEGLGNDPGRQGRSL
ncbi:hypothetical protein [Spirosoma radiotolerans]|uniref:Uncharacterized protein n=1 Tax=Spirosoma radiotolerans TaxID=1379870 RepID=A0A0E3V5Z6_9BACT|nr:hypothetical protein [Spirosoma radiotolerans]AKD54587.1 hypothetical protein SD10_06345 [Spirosoma radiotolerans]